MNELTQLLTEAAEAAEHEAPRIDPVHALACVRERRRRRSAHVAALALVGFVLALQLEPAAAFGAPREDVVVVVAGAAGE